MRMVSYSVYVPVSRSKILVIGGGSRIAAALAPHLGDRARWVCRRKGARANEYCVTDYDNIPLAAFDDVSCVVNCVGISNGSRAELNNVNIGHATQCAHAAKSAGVPRFVHISSFSVYGSAERIDRTKSPAPTSDYGRSKLAADVALTAMNNADFNVTLLRLPLIYAVGGFGKMGKLGHLLSLWRRLRIWPVPTSDVARAMISVDLSAEVIAHLIDDNQRIGIVFAADPQSFTYACTAAARPLDQLRQLRVPRQITGILRLIAPSVGIRLFADSRLADEDNLAIQYGLASLLYRDISAANPG